ncbi:MAG TPA: hypothetical protein VFQ89_03930, partial [Candidatus Binatia bacterium]|nr:hypothetical protein [Candidatus Binatia bacterium]
ISLEKTYAGRFQATTRHEASVILAKAGIHPIPPMETCPGSSPGQALRRHDGLMKEPVARRRRIS